MTVHGELKMYHEDRRIKDPELIRGILDQNMVCTLAMHDEPFPYVVPMNYGYDWEEKLIFYLHMAPRGHRRELLLANPNVAINIWKDVNRWGYEAYRGEKYDYRSVTVFGRAEILEPQKENPEILKALNCISVQGGRPAFKKFPEPCCRDLAIIKVTAKEITAKSLYPIKELKEVLMPPAQAK